MDYEDQAPPSPTHQAIMSMVDNYTHFETTYRNYPEAAIPVLEQVRLLRAALETFRIAVEEHNRPDTTPVETNAEPPALEEEEPHQVPVCKEEAVTITLPLQVEYELDVPYIDKAVSIECDAEPVVDANEPITQEASLPSIGPDGSQGQDSNPDSTDGPIALSTQEEKSDL